MKRFGNLFDQICELENLYQAYRVCLRGKRLKRDVLPVTFNLSAELLQLQRAMRSGSYRTGPYYGFYVYEPKKRLVQALPFRDRIVQQALCQVITRPIERSFIYDTYACRIQKGTHAGSCRLQHFLRSAQDRWGRVWCLQCDVRSYFQSIDHQILQRLFEEKIKCRRTLDLIRVITDSNGQTVGIPIGNLLSQLSANLYLDGLDHYMKEKLKIRYYIRYMDDFCLIHGGKKYLGYLWRVIEDYLREERLLELNQKTALFPIAQGVDFLGYRTWPDHKLLRKRSVKRMRRKMRAMARHYAAGQIPLDRVTASIRSWVAHCRHANAYHLREKVLKTCKFQRENTPLSPTDHLKYSQ